MRLDAANYAGTVVEAAETLVAAEQRGYDAGWVPETKIDPFIGLAVAAERTSRIELMTGIAVAFARSPMTVAVQANDLQLLSGGRFVLGLGSQVKPHITKRFGMPWSAPAARMREFVLAVRAIWAAFATGERLRFTGEFYTHTLMTPFFDPGPNPHGNPKVYLAAVGERMTEVAGEVADGMLCHGFSTERYLREVTLPALERGRAKAGRTLAGFDISGPSFVATGATEEKLVASIAAVRKQIAFYGSTPSYRAVLDLHGWGGLQDDLNALSKRGKWAEMDELIDDEVLNTFAVVGEPAVAAAEIKRRYGDVVTRMSVPAALVPVLRDAD